MKAHLSYSGPEIDSEICNSQIYHFSYVFQTLPWQVYGSTLKQSFVKCRLIPYFYHKSSKVVKAELKLVKLNKEDKSKIKWFKKGSHESQLC